jgi:hypothetical protein
MFWTRKKKETPSVATPFGVFSWDGEFAWHCDYELDGKPLMLTYIGSQIDVTDLQRFGKAFQQLDEYCQLALSANVADIEFYGHLPIQMTLFGLTVDRTAVDEDVQLDFCFENWPDGGLTVHFKDGRILESHIDD